MKAFPFQEMFQPNSIKMGFPTTRKKIVHWTQATAWLKGLDAKWQVEGSSSILGSIKYLWKADFASAFDIEKFTSSKKQSLR